jgi:hypothetical protein
MVIYLLCRVHNLGDEFDIQALLFQRFKKYHRQDETISLMLCNHANPQVV